MSYIGQAPGLGQRTRFRFVATAGQTTFSGPDANGYPLGYTPGLVDVFINDGLVSEPNYTASDGSTIIVPAGLTALDELQIIAQAPFSPANTYTLAQADAAFTRRRNRIVDPGMRVSQENGNSLLTLSANSIFYPSDGVFAQRNAASGTLTVQRVALTTPGGSPYRVRATVTATNAAPAAGDTFQLQTRVEGVDVADLRFGTTAARTVAFRIGCRASVAGTYSVAIANGALNRTWIGTFTIAPGEVGTDVVKTVTLTGDQTGTWAADNTIGLTFSITLCAGTTYQGVAGWQSGTPLAVASSTNLMATNGATFDLFDVGLYDVTGLQQGVIPPFELEAFDRDLQKCLRYYEAFSGLLQSPVANTMGVSQPYKATKRVSPTVTNAVGTNNNLASFNVNGGGPDRVDLQVTASAAGGYAFYSIFANARL